MPQWPEPQSRKQQQGPLKEAVLPPGQAPRGGGGLAAGGPYGQKPSKPEVRSSVQSRLRPQSGSSQPRAVVHSPGVSGSMSGPSTEELDQLYREYTLRRQANGYRTHVDYWTWLSSRQRPGARERRDRRVRERRVRRRPPKG